MLPKAKSVTTSLTSVTSNRARPASSPASTDIQYVKGVGPKLGALFKSRGISTVRDLLFFFPRTYEDRSKTLTIAELPAFLDQSEAPSLKATIQAQIVSIRRIPIARLGRSLIEARASDASGTLSLKWFRAPPGLESRLPQGKSFFFTGVLKRYQSRIEMIHPEISSLDQQGQTGRMVPVYTELEAIPTRLIRKMLWSAVQNYADLLEEDLPAWTLEKHRLPRLAQAIPEIHFPPAGASAQALEAMNTPSHHRLIYEEFFKWEYFVLRQRLKMRRSQAIAFGTSGGARAAEELSGKLPFRLTGDQQKAVQSILKDLSEPHPMNRLIQGDVGSGKTAVALLSCAAVLAEGAQAALMAPTEILAEQHFKKAGELFRGKLNAAILTGRTSAAERKLLHSRLIQGEPLLLIGTHALIEEAVRFKNLAYVLIDEQHRFGVEQRKALRMKGTHRDPIEERLVEPHQLILTATPIPRTLALTAYGDLAVTSVRELPPGRQPIQTRVIRDAASRKRVYEAIRSEMRAGRQAYFIFPLVNESEAEGFQHLKSAIAEAERLTHEVFPEFKVGLLHGQMRSEDKVLTMERFKKNELQLLISTTVIEVGVDVPNANVIVIEHAERFGLSQLHQLRGRVGRGSSAASCYLMTSASSSEATRMRLDLLESCTDGFQIAEADLELRGPGDFLGTKQAGELPFRMASLVRDQAWLLAARDDAISILKEDPDLLEIQNRAFRQFIAQDGRIQLERLKTS